MMSERPDEDRITDDKIKKLISTEVTAVTHGTISKVFGSIKITMTERFDERYIVVTEVVVDATTTVVVVVVVGVQGRGLFKHRYFSNMKPPEFDGVKDPVISMRWLANVEGCFFTCACMGDQKVKCSLNLLRLGEKYWWRLVTGAYSLAEKPQ